MVTEARGCNKEHPSWNSSPFAALGRRHEGQDVASHKNQDELLLGEHDHNVDLYGNASLSSSHGHQNYNAKSTKLC